MVISLLCVLLCLCLSALWLSGSVRRSQILLPVLLVCMTVTAALMDPADVLADELDATSSNAVKADLDLEGGDADESGSNDLSLSFLRGLYVLLSGPDAVDLAEEGDIIPYEGDIGFLDEGDTAAPFALQAYNSVSNVIAYDVTVNGSDYVLYLSPDYVDSLYIDSQDRLWNVSTSNISGRLFSGDFDALATSGYLVTLGPCLGNNFSSNRNYGSPNYMRRYYWSGSSLTYDTTYIIIKVNQSRYPFRVSDSLGYIIIFLLGGGLLCLWKKSLR